MKMFEEVKMVHTYREPNLCANTLAKFNVDSGKDLIFREEIMDFIRKLVIYDVIGTFVPILVLL